MPKVLVSDKLSKTAVQIFKDNGVDVDYLPDLGKDKDKLLEVIGQYDGLAIRSATKVTEKIIGAAKNLKVVGRAGIGVDNVDIPAASRKGIIVMNTPFGNSITTAEHAVAMIFALARQIPEADASEVDCDPEQLPGRFDERTLRRQLPARGDHSGAVTGARSEAVWVRKIRVHVLRAVDAVEDQDDLAVRRDPVAVDHRAHPPYLALELRRPGHRRSRRRCQSTRSPRRPSARSPATSWRSSDAARTSPRCS